jgi:hypothetical protein
MRRDHQNQLQEYKVANLAHFSGFGRRPDSIAATEEAFKNGNWTMWVDSMTEPKIRHVICELELCGHKFDMSKKCSLSNMDRHREGNACSSKVAAL